MPAPGVVDMAEIWGPEVLTPQPFAAADILATLGPLPGPLTEAALIQSSSIWLDHFPTSRAGSKIPDPFAMPCRLPQNFFLASVRKQVLCTACGDLIIPNQS